MDLAVAVVGAERAGSSLSDPRQAVPGAPLKPHSPGAEAVKPGQNMAALLEHSVPVFAQPLATLGWYC